MSSLKNVTIRRIRLDELDVIQGFYASQVSQDHNPITAIRSNPRQLAWEMRRVRQQLLTQQKYLSYIAVAELADGTQAYAGYASAIIEEQAHIYEVENVASIEELWVEPSYRGQGIGRALMEELFEGIEEIGVSWVTVRLPEDIDGTRAFLEKMGFEQKTVELQAHLDTKN